MVDDDRLFLDAIVDFLEPDALEIRCCDRLETARRLVDDGYDVLVLDRHLPDGDSFEWIQELRAADNRARIVMVTAQQGVDSAVEALRLRIDDYFTKPVDPEGLRLAILRCLDTLRLERIEWLVDRQADNEASRTISKLRGEGLAAVRRDVEKAARARQPVLITGETGTGKSLVASALHHLGGSGRPFVKINCAAIPENLIESELFGVARGAFTGAEKDRPGLFEMADGGTLFLDEIGELSVAVQAKLLAVLEDRAARRVGDTQLRNFDVRVVAATNLAIDSALRDGKFREDLYYRLAVLRVEVPPLRQRLGDLADLCTSILSDLVPRSAGLPPLSADELSALAAYRWPGNVRELRNVLERCLLSTVEGELRPSQLLHAGELDASRPATRPQVDPDTPVLPLAEVEELHIRAALHRFDGNRTHTAEALGIGLSTLRRKLASYRSDDS